MAGPLAPHSPCQNTCPAGENELTGAAPTKRSSTLTPTPTVSRASIPAPVIVPFLNKELFKQFIKAYLEAQVPAQIAPEIDPKPCKQPLKAWFSDFYYANLHMDCYQFCLQCKDHFETIGAKKPNRILFAALFLCVLVT